MSFPCCVIMQKQLELTCTQHGSDCPDRVISEGKGELIPANKGKLFLSAPNADYRFEFCPWCGQQLPEERRA